MITIIGAIQTKKNTFQFELRLMMDQIFGSFIVKGKMEKVYMKS